MRTGIGIHPLKGNQHAIRTEPRVVIPKGQIGVPLVSCSGRIGDLSGIAPVVPNRPNLAVPCECNATTTSPANVCVVETRVIEHPLIATIVFHNMYVQGWIAP